MTMDTTTTARTNMAMDSTDERIVRFDDECVLIPDIAPRPRTSRMLTKSYSLPLWRRRSNSTSALSDTESDSPEDSHVVLKVPVLSFSPKSTSPRSSEMPPPLSPCLVRTSRAASLSPTRSPRERVRRPSLPPSPNLDVVTVPLRACCTACVFATEDCIRQGDQWKAKFSFAARAKQRACLYQPPRTFSMLAAMKCNEAVGAKGSRSAVSAISVDEVDKRCRSVDSSEGIPSEQDDGEELSLPRSPSTFHSVFKEHLDDSSLIRSPSTPCIKEEDEDRFFASSTSRKSRAESHNLTPSTSSTSLVTPITSVSADTSMASVVGSSHTTQHNDDGPLSSSLESSYLFSEELQDFSRRRTPSPDLLSAFPSLSARSTSQPFPSSEMAAQPQPVEIKKHLSFSIRSPAQFFRVGADMLKGVGAMSSPAGPMPKMYV